MTTRKGTSLRDERRTPAEEDSGLARSPGSSRTSSPCRQERQRLEQLQRQQQQQQQTDDAGQAEGIASSAAVAARLGALEGYMVESVVALTSAMGALSRRMELFLQNAESVAPAQQPTSGMAEPPPGPSVGQATPSFAGVFRQPAAQAPRRQKGPRQQADIRNFMSNTTGPAAQGQPGQAEQRQRQVPSTSCLHGTETTTGGERQHAWLQLPGLGRLLPPNFAGAPGGIPGETGPPEPGYPHEDLYSDTSDVLHPGERSRLPATTEEAMVYYNHVRDVVRGSRNVQQRDVHEVSALGYYPAVWEHLAYDQKRLIWKRLQLFELVAQYGWRFALCLMPAPATQFSPRVDPGLLLHATQIEGRGPSDRAPDRNWRDPETKDNGNNHHGTADSSNNNNLNRADEDPETEDPNSINNREEEQAAPVGRTSLQQALDIIRAQHHLQHLQVSEDVTTERPVTPPMTIIRVDPQTPRASTWRPVPRELFPQRVVDPRGSRLDYLLGLQRPDPYEPLSVPVPQFQGMRLIDTA